MYHPQRHAILPTLLRNHESLRMAFILKEGPGPPGHYPHDMCSLDFCELSQLNYTSVAQRHEGKGCAKLACRPIRDRFARTKLDQAAKTGRPTAWQIQGVNTATKSMRYMAISHVWSDGTGAGTLPAGHVNSCLYYFFCDLARRFDCDGIWWDTLCIPQARTARAIAINKMQVNFEKAACTLVHDCFLRNVRFVDSETACIALLMSPWFSRGWTALELASSHNVHVLFREDDGPLAVSLDQLLDSPRTEGHRLAADIIKRLRARRIEDINHLLQALGPRHTSWSKDRMIIAGLLVGTGSESAQSQGEDVQADNLLQQELTTRILAKIRYVSRGHLFHGLPTVACNSGWYPAQLLSLPLDVSGEVLEVDDHGAVTGQWRVLPVDGLPAEQYRWDLVHPMIALRLRQSFKCAASHRCLLEMKRNVDRALIVRLDASDASLLSCWVTGSLRFKQDRNISGLSFTEERVKIMSVRGDSSLASLATHTAGGEEKDARQIVSTLRDTEHERNPSVSRHRPARCRLRAPQTFNHTWGDGREKNLIDFALPQNAGLLPLDLDEVKVFRIDHSFGYALPASASEQLGRMVHMDLTEKFHLAQCMGNTQSGVFVRNQSGRSTLSRAAGRGHVNEVRALLDGYTNEKISHMMVKDLQVLMKFFHNSMDNGGRTPLSWAAGEGHVEVVALLLRCPAVELEIPSVCGWTPLWYAVDNDQIDTARILLSAGANIDRRIGAAWQPHVLGVDRRKIPLSENRNMNLAFAVQLSADLAMIGMLLDYGARLDDFAWRMLDAVNGDDKADVQFLCDAGMRPDGRSQSFVELEHALWKGHRVPNILDRCGARSFHSVCDLAKRLRGDGSSLTPMRVAFVMGRAEIFSIMLEAETALHYDRRDNLHDLLRNAVEYRQLASGEPGPQLAMIKMILQTPGSGVNRTDQDPQQGSVLHIAAGRGDVDVVNLLLADPNVDVNVYRRRGRRETPLHEAVYSRWANVVEALLQAPGIDWNAASKGGTPVEIAKRHGYVGIVQILQDFARHHDRGNTN